MAVEARNLNLFHPQIISNREFLYTNQESGMMNTTTYNNNGHMGSLSHVPLMTTTMADGVLPLNQALICEYLQPKTSMNTDSGLTACNVPVSRKRSRDCFDQNNLQKNNNAFSQYSNGFDIVSNVQQYELDVDSIISQHTKKMRMEIEQRQKQHARLIVQAIGESLVKKMNEKDEQLQKMAKLNYMLQEKVKSLYIENHLWRDMAQTNEATANNLRTNLEQVLALVPETGFPNGVGTRPVVAVEEEDVQSCCGSSSSGNKGIDEDKEVEVKRESASRGHDKLRMCRVCGERESCVLLLPCRHLCLCTYCGSSLLPACPVCNSNMNATVHVNMSSS